MKVAFFGEVGSHTELAARNYFKPGSVFVPCQAFSDVFTSVERGKTSFGVIPIENSLTGSIHQNYDLLLHHKLNIAGEIFMGVSQNLIALRGVHRRSLKRILSHPQGLAQCERYLKKSPHLVLVPVQDTAAAVRIIKQQRLTDAAAIASEQAAIDNDMAILARDIQDFRNNITRFLILSANQTTPAASRQKTKTSIVFSAKNVPGALFRCLAVFALRDIDLYKIESRPIRGKKFEYIFYLDFAGGASETAQKYALDHLAEITVFIRVLGSYPVGKLVHPKFKKRNS